MPNTTNLNLVVTDDDTELFEDWRKDINGVDNSNTKKIDDFAGKFVGGTANQYYKKNSSTKFDGEWETPDGTPTENSTKLITSGGVHTAIETAKTGISTEIDEAVSAVDNGGKVTVATAGEVSQELLPDVFYNFTGALTALILTLGTAVDERENEYKGQFLSGATAPTVTLPLGVSWIGGTPTIEASKTYQFSILNGIGIMVGI